MKTFMSLFVPLCPFSQKFWKGTENIFGFFAVLCIWNIDSIVVIVSVMQFMLIPINFPVILAVLLWCNPVLVWSPHLNYCNSYEYPSAFQVSLLHWESLHLSLLCSSISAKTFWHFLASLAQIVANKAFQTILSDRSQWDLSVSNGFKFLSGSSNELIIIY